MSDVHLTLGRARSPTPCNAMVASRVFAGVAAVLASLLGPATANAQNEHWVVLTATAGEPSEDVTAAALHAEAALAASGDSLISRDRAAARVESALSTPYEAVPASLRDELATAGEEALEHVAFGRNASALEVGLPILERLDRFRASIGRDEQAAQDTANLCLYLLRAHVQLGDTARAREQASSCVRLVPDLIVQPSTHPPSVRSVIDDLRRELAEGGGLLAVHSSPGDPSGCAIRVNGRRLGETPSLRGSLPPGRYAVQVECEQSRPGRVHDVTVATERAARLAVDARLAQALETRPAIGMRYPDSAALDERVERDVLRIASLAGATRVLLVVSDGASMTLRAYAVRSGTSVEAVGAATVATPISDRTSREALREALARREPGASVRGHDEGLLIAGVTLLGVALAGTGGSVATGIAAIDANDDALRGCVRDRCPEELGPAADEAHALAIATDALLFSAVGMAIAGAVVLIVDGVGARARATPGGSASCGRTRCSFVGVRF